MTALRQIWAIVAKDVSAEMRTREVLSAMGIYAVLGLVTFSVALDLRGALARAAAPGVLWMTVTFAGMLGLSRSMEREQEQQAMDGMLLAPVDRSVIYLGKVAGNLLFLMLVEAVAMPLAAGLLGVALLRIPILAVTLLGTIGYAAAGTLLAAISVNTRAQAVALPVLFLPLLIPVILGVVQSTAGLLEGSTLAEVAGWVQLLAAYDLVVIAAGMLTFAYVVED
ncbi:MAG: ABC transporter permease [Chloroflexi bacterium]|nr:ABC transporter permease [Chloroflexota bacterium]